MKTTNPDSERREPVDNRLAYAAGGEGSAALDTLENADRYNQWIASKILPYIGRRNLELGPGKGAITRWIAERAGVTLVEASPVNQTTLRQKFADRPEVSLAGGDFFTIGATDAAEFGEGNLQKRLPRGWDCVYSSNVLEHIEDDMAVIEHASRILAHGGYFVAFTPAGQWLYSEFDRQIGHFRRYCRQDRKRIDAALHRRGLPLRFRAFEFYNPLGAIGWLLRMRWLGGSGINRRDAALMNRLIGPLSLLDPIPWPTGQNALIVLQKDEPGA